MDLQKSKARRDRRIAVARQRVRNSFSKMTPAQLVERAMELYEERNGLAEVLRLKQFERL